ncbi:hypothetical protein Acife_0519 [Acidithiobacillus ferrivorans SS3]|uniref:Uncharacterized protein n=1 Tax=Acidithiobacillus ferrivorans SS3 TaxID=743299 RepID=G0JTX4_9PROT|nr:hypothetical protein [Acidithiobacillus ferrivorans]AEM46726.1 hypothetical protein Acife_0519 [Acidithiobacillus ferrivorans SS3]OFA15682.1 hypothetical protein A4U49_11585 [Acidithiobacillus ferrivorans]
MNSNNFSSFEKHIALQGVTHFGALVLFNSNSDVKKVYQKYGWQIHAAIFAVMVLAYFWAVQK